MSNYTYDTTFQQGISEGGNSGSGGNGGSGVYNNVGQLQTPYFGKRYGIIGDYGPIYGDSTSSEYLGNKYPSLINTFTGEPIESPFSPPSTYMGSYEYGAPPLLPHQKRVPDYKPPISYARGSSIVGAVVFPGGSGSIPVNWAPQYYRKNIEFGGWWDPLTRNYYK